MTYSNNDQDDSINTGYRSASANILHQDRAATEAHLNHRNTDQKDTNVTETTPMWLHHANDAEIRRDDLVKSPWSNSGLARRVPADQYERYADMTPADMKAAVDTIHRDPATAYRAYIDDCRITGALPLTKRDWRQTLDAAHHILTN